MSGLLRCFHPAPEAPVRLVVFPHAGGSASAYHPLSAAVRGRAEARVAQYPGRQDRFEDPPARSVHDLVSAAVADLPGSAGPLALFGHSMGAVVAFETARRLTALGRPPRALVVSGREAPSRPWLRGGDPAPHELDDTDLVAEMRLLSGTEDELLDNPDILQLALPPLRADYQALHAYTYRPAPPLPCPVTVLTGDADPRVTLDGAHAWSAETSADFAVHVLEGGHFYLMDRVPEVASLITGTVSSPSGATG